jgi:acetyltransferase-like isoleucine patch superfamily enzyme
MKQVGGPHAAQERLRYEAPATGNRASDKRGPWLFRIALEETAELRSRVHLAQGLGNLLPQFCFNRLRTGLLRAAGMQIGEGSLFMGDVTFSGAGDWCSLFSVGNDTLITGPVRINLGGPVHIGNAVNIGHDCLFLTVDHEIGPQWRRAGTSTHGPIFIEDGVWIASRVTILPGITVGTGAVVAAGAVVCGNVPPHTLVGGVPAKVLRTLSSAQ